jgi:hypothetical protein
MKAPKSVTTTKQTDFWECSQCGITSSTSGRMIPCPRGSCEAKVTGQMITVVTKTLIRYEKKEESKQLIDEKTFSQV